MGKTAFQAAWASSVCLANATSPVSERCFCVSGRHSTAYKSLLDRAKIGGNSLPKLRRQDLADTLNVCLSTQKNAKALLLIRDQKVSAVHSGDEKDYSILPINELMEGIKTKLDERFPGSVFDSGYGDHALTSAAWSPPDQKDDLLGSYHKTLAAQGKAALVAKLMPGIRFWADFILDPKANAIGYGMLATAQLQKLSVNGGASENA